MNAQLHLVKRLLLAAAGIGILALVAPTIQAEDLKIEAQLIWGTNDSKSPDPKHKDVEADVAKRLKDLPFKWTHYFEVTRKQIEVPQQDPKQVRMSDECEITVKRVNEDQVELILFGKGKRVGKVTQRLPRNELLVMGGNAPNFTAWFVVLKRAD